MPNNSDSYRPTIAQVGSILRARTKDKFGTELGTFNEDTRPTGQQVEDLIDLALGDTAAALGQSVPSVLWQPATMLVAINTANLIQASYWPEQVESDNAVFEFWTDWYTNGLKRLAMAVSDELDGGSEGEDSTATFPVWGDGDALCVAKGAEVPFGAIWDSYVRSPAAMSLYYDQLPLWVRRDMGI